MEEEENKQENEKENNNEEDNQNDNNEIKNLEQKNIRDNNNIINTTNENINQNENIINENTKNENNNNNILINTNKESQIKEEKSQDIQTDKNIFEKNSDKLLNIPIYIYSAKTIEINSVSILIYFIKGKLVKKEILRTFDDFDLLHQVLSTTWPCLFIPGLAFKESSSSSKTSNKFPEIKTKLLNHFLKKLSESKPLLNCDATKIFLSQDKNFSMKLSQLNTSNNYKEISERYFKIFTDYIEDKKIIDEKEANIKKFIKLLDITYKKLEEVGKTIENEIYNIKNEQNSLDFVTKMFLDLEKSIPNSQNYLTNINVVVKPFKSVSLYILLYIYITIFLFNYRIVFLNHILYFILIF